MIGQTFNQYQITASIGAGGMGEVFRARDTRLNRDVAIKVLPKDLVGDADRLRRFEQEAKTLAALNHPNILTIHDAGVHEGAPYLVSELLRGRTLREEMEGGALPLRKATDYALQIAQGLAAAHSTGVVHRDLKPENIFITQDGRAKILDFGLAKLRSADVRTGPAVAGSTIKIDPTAIVNTTEPGMILGTPAYMSPEQVRGEPADHRADIFAFGAVLYEMLSGTRAFRRDTPVASMNAILSEEVPDLTNTRPEPPPALIRIVHRCLEKQPDRRFQSAHDLAFALEGVSGTNVVAQGAKVPEKLARRAAVAAGVVVIVASVFFFKHWRRDLSHGSTTSPAVHRKFELNLPFPGTLLADGEELHPVISPDGRKIAFANAEGLWLRWLDRVGPAAQLVAGEGIVHPFWSPQSTDVGYFDFDGAKLARVSVQGGRTATLATVPKLEAGAGYAGIGAGAAWLANDRILFASGAGGLDEVSAQGGAVTAVWKPNAAIGEVDLHEASPLPDSLGALVVVHRKAGVDTIAIYKRSGERITVLQEPGADYRNPVYSRTGHILFERIEGEIWAIPFSIEQMERTDEPFRVSDTGTALSVSDEATLLTTSIQQNGRRQLAWVERSGKSLPAFGPILPGLASPRLSPDERRIIVAAGDSVQARDLWLVEITGGALPLTRHPGADSQPYWQENGRSVLFGRYENGRNMTLAKLVDGSAGEQVLYEGRATPSPGGEYVLLEKSFGASLTQEWQYTEAGTTNQRPLQLTQLFGPVTSARISADARWLAISAAAGGQQNDIWVLDFPQMTRRTMVSRGGGYDPCWHVNSRALFFLSRDRKAMMSVQQKPDDGGFEEPQKLFDLPEGVYAGAAFVPSIYDVTADGSRFLMVKKAEDGSSTNQVTRPNVLLVENWFEEYREKK